MTRFIDEHRQTYGVGSICKILPIAPSVYYASVTAVSPEDVIAPCIGAWFVFERQSLWGIEPGNRGSLGINQAMQRIENRGLGRHTIFESQFNRAEDSLLIMLQHKG